MSSASNMHQQVTVSSAASKVACFKETKQEATHKSKKVTSLWKKVVALGESDLMEATSRRTGCGGPSKVKLVRVGWIMSMEACTPSRSRVSL